MTMLWCCDSPSSEDSGHSGHDHYGNNGEGEYGGDSEGSEGGKDDEY